MKKYKMKICICLTLFLLKSNWLIALAETDKTSIQYVAKSIESIKTYNVNLNTKIFSPNSSDSESNFHNEFDPKRYIETRSVVYGESGKKMKMIITINSPELRLEKESTLIFNGTWLWVQQKLKKISRYENQRTKDFGDENTYPKCFTRPNK